MAEVRVPTLGESVTEATVATWFKKVGDAVKVDEMLCELETDKVTVEVPATASGVLEEIVAKEGESVGLDALLATINEKAEAMPAQKAATKPAPAAEESAKAVDIMVPTLGESVTEATVATWFKKVGDTVAQDEMLCELETDKVSVEVPSPAAGVLAEILAEAGSTVSAGGKLGVISGGSAAAAKVGAPKPPAEDPAKGIDAGPAEVKPRDVEDAPSAKRILAEKGIDPASVQGSGRDGRVMKEDALKAEARPAVAPAPAPAPAAIPRA